MRRDAIFEIWAPASARWSAWAKPVLFAELPTDQADVVEVFAKPAPDGPQVVQRSLLGFEAPAPEQVVLIVNLPGAKAVRVGLSLAERGFRPVPLFNALPGGALSLVDVTAIQAALVAGATSLRACELPEQAPPAFLLDASRDQAHLLRAPEVFDNRSVASVSDFPSGKLLLEAGLTRALLIGQGTLAPPSDLVPTLVDWRAAGLRIEALDITSADPASDCRLPRSAWWSRIQNAWHAMSRNSDGTFGRSARAAS